MTRYATPSRSTKPYLHFSREEFADRQARVRRALDERGLDGLLVSRIEDQYWLCGLDTCGFVIFHIMFIGGNGELTHVTRTADLASALRPGRALGEVYDIHVAAFRCHGYEHAALKACGYTMGATFSPTWMEMPMIYRGNPVMLQENMVFFTHMILSDFETGLTMSLGQTSIITSGGPEIIAHVPREPIIRQ